MGDAMSEPGTEDIMGYDINEEAFFLHELVRAMQDLETILTDYNQQKLESYCRQALKNRVWDIHQYSENGAL